MFWNTKHNSFTECTEACGLKAKQVKIASNDIIRSKVGMISENTENFRVVSSCLCSVLLLFGDDDNEDDDIHEATF